MKKETNFKISNWYMSETGDTPVCDWIFQATVNITVHVVTKNMSSRFISNNDPSASEFLHNLKDMFPRDLYR